MTQANTTSNTTNEIIRDVTLNWVKLTNPEAPFGTEIYSLQAEFPKSRSDEMSKYGVVKEKEGRFFINLKKKAIKADGTPAAKVPVVDTQKNPIDPNTVGNGSKGNVMVMMRPFEIKTPKGVVTKSGTTVALSKVQVTELIKYVPKNDNFTDFDYTDEFDATGDNQRASLVAPKANKPAAAPVDSDF
jgi:hypothetical protein